MPNWLVVLFEFEEVFRCTGTGVCEKRTVALHDLEELGDDLGGRADHDLALAGLLGVVDVLESIVENGSLDHFGGLGVEILKS